MAADVIDEQLVSQLAERARTEGLRLVGEGGLLARLTKIVLEGAAEGEMDAHLGYGKHDAAGRDGGNSRNGYRSKTVLTDIGPVEIGVPRDRDGSFAPQIVKKRQRRLYGVDELVCSKNDHWLHHRAAALNLRRLINLGLNHNGTGWALS